MIKKLKFINSVPLILSALTTIIILIACGSGEIEGINDKDVKTSQDILKIKTPGILSSIMEAPIYSSCSPVSSSSSTIEGNSSGGSNTSGSSSSGTSSSGTAPSPSSSSVTPSSSGPSLYNLTCTMTVHTGVAGTSIPEDNRPKLKCEVKASGEISNVKLEDITWPSAPRWPAPVEGSYNVVAKVDSDNKATKCQGLEVECGAFTVCPRTGCPVSSSSVAPPPSSSSSSSTTVVVSSSSSRPSSSSAVPSSSSSRPSSSSVVPSSSSSRPSSSSAVVSSSSVAANLACNMTATTGTVGTAITPTPTVQCNGTGVTTGLTWTPTNLTPTAEGSVAVSVSASCGGSAKTATCGNVTVSAAPANLTCTMTATTGTVGTAITPTPTVQCNGTGVTTGLTWTPTNLTPTAAGSVAVSVNASCGGSAKTATCGNVTVAAASSCEYQTSYCNGAAFSTVLTPATIPSNPAAGCYLLQDFTQLSIYNSGTIKVNGTDYTDKVVNGNVCASWSTPTCENFKATLTKKDGGYYVYMGSNGAFGTATAGTKNPSCQ